MKNKLKGIFVISVRFYKNLRVGIFKSKRCVLIKSIENAEFQGVGYNAYHLFRLENVQAQVIYTLASVPSKD